MMTILLPIPTPKKKYEVFYIPYEIKDGYINKNFAIGFKSSDFIRTFREEAETKFGIDKGSYVVSMVNNNIF